MSKAMVVTSGKGGVGKTTVAAATGLALAALAAVLWALYITVSVPIGKAFPGASGLAPAMFLGAMIPTGYFAFVKILEITGGILVAIPRTRPLGLLALGPIVVNILCFHTFLTKGAGLVGLPLLVAALALFLLWTERAAFSRLLPHAK